MTIICCVADDHPAVLEAVCGVLQSAGIDVVGRASDGDQALAIIERHRPQVAILDLSMPGRSGTDVVRAVAASSPETWVIVYTAYGDRALLLEAIDAGARGFLLKGSPLADLPRAVELAANGEMYVDAALAGDLIAIEFPDQKHALTKREREILRLLADGQSNDEIGKRLFISPETVRTYIRRAMRKLEADTRTQAVATALRRSLIA